MSRSKRPSLSADQMRSHANEAAQLLKTLANDKRLMILCLLAEREHAVGELNAELDLSQPALSQHLAVLRQEGLVTTQRDGQSVLYALARGPAKRILETLHSVYCGRTK